MKKFTRFTYNITGCTEKHCGGCKEATGAFVKEAPFCGATGEWLERDKTRKVLRSDRCIKGEVKRRKE